MPPNRHTRSAGKRVSGDAQASAPPDRQPNDVTMLLDRAARGDRAATDELFPVVYEELRSLAARYLDREGTAQTLQPTDLVHEAYLRLVGPREAGWENRAHFFGAAARAVRRILTDRARARTRQKRGGGRRPLPAEEAESVAAGGLEPPELLALDDALTRLATLDEQKARVVELRFFGGLGAHVAAAALGVSASTVARDWQFARIWLHREMGA